MIDWQKTSMDFKPQTQVRDVPPSLPRIYAFLKLLFLPQGRLPSSAGETIVIKHEPAIIPLLRAGRITDALQTAYQRLVASGVVPLTKEFHWDDRVGTRLAAALLFPIDEPSIQTLATLVLRKKDPRTIIIGDQNVTIRHHLCCA